MSEPMTAAEKIEEARRLAAESLERFRWAALKERQSRSAGHDEHTRIFGEAVAEESRAIEQFGEAVELQRQAVEEQVRGSEQPNSKKRGKR